MFHVEHLQATLVFDGGHLQEEVPATMRSDQAWGGWPKHQEACCQAQEGQSQEAARADCRKPLVCGGVLGIRRCCILGVHSRRMREALTQAREFSVERVQACNLPVNGARTKAPAPGGWLEAEGHSGIVVDQHALHASRVGVVGGGV